MENIQPKFEPRPPTEGGETSPSNDNFVVGMESAIEQACKKIKLDEDHEENGGVSVADDPGVRACTNTLDDGGNMENAEIADELHVPDNVVASDDAGVHDNDEGRVPSVPSGRTSELQPLLSNIRPDSIDDFTSCLQIKIENLEIVQTKLEPRVSTEDGGSSPSNDNLDVGLEESAVEHTRKKIKLDEYLVPIKHREIGETSVGANDPAVYECIPDNGRNDENSGIAEELHVPDNPVGSDDAYVHDNDEASVPSVPTDGTSELQPLLSNIRPDSIADFTSSLQIKKENLEIVQPKIEPRVLTEDGGTSPSNDNLVVGLEESALEHTCKKIKLEDNHVPMERKENGEASGAADDPGVRECTNTLDDDGNLENIEIAKELHVPENLVASEDAYIHDNDEASVPSVSTDRSSKLELLLSSIRPDSIDDSTSSLHVEMGNLEIVQTKLEPRVSTEDGGSSPSNDNLDVGLEESAVEHTRKKIKLDEYLVPIKHREIGETSVGANNPAVYECIPDNGGNDENSGIAEELHVPDNPVGSDDASVHDNDEASVPSVSTDRSSKLQLLLSSIRPDSIDDSTSSLQINMENMEIVQKNIDPPVPTEDGGTSISIDNLDVGLEESAVEHTRKKIKLDEYLVPIKHREIGETSVGANNPAVHDGANHGNTGIADECHVPIVPSVSSTRAELMSLLSNIRPHYFNNFTRSDLEELIVQKMCEAITETTEVKKLLRRAQICENEVFKWKNRAMSCEKQIKDLKYVVENCRSQLNDGKPGMPRPIHVCRSISVQVSMDSKYQAPLDKWTRSPDVIDLSYDEQTVSGVSPSVCPPDLKHPAPLPITDSSHVMPEHSSWKSLLPRPTITLNRTSDGIVLTWDMPSDAEHARVVKYELFGYPETTEAPQTSLWRLIGVIKALSLPLSCTLQKFVAGHSYHFAVRGVDIHGRPGAFSYPGTIFIEPNPNSDII